MCTCILKKIDTEALVVNLVRKRNEVLTLKKLYENENLEEETLVNMAQLVQQEIRNLEDTMPWPPEPTDLTPEQLRILRKLDLLLDTLLQNKTGVLNSRNGIVKLSFAQEIVFAVTSGRVKTP